MMEGFVAIVAVVVVLSAIAYVAYRARREKLSDRNVQKPQPRPEDYR